MSEKINFLQSKALTLRIDSIRATTASKSGHPTSCLSAADVIAALFFQELNYDFKNPKASDNDRFIMSKGHAIPVVYAAYKGLGVLSDKQFMTLRDVNSVLEGHPTPRFVYNEAATGSLGQGLGIGVGMALSAKAFGLGYTTYVMMGDGEISEGSIWEAAGFAAHNNLDNMIGVVDCNRLGQAGSALHDHDVEKYAQQFQAFGWQTFVIDGHDMEKIVQTLDEAKKVSGKPSVIIAKTFKGYGLENIQNKIGFHGKPFKPEEAEVAIESLKNFFESKGISPSQDESYLSVNIEQPEQRDVSEPIVLDLEKDPHTKLFDKTEKIATRKAFGYALAALGRTSKKVFALDGDVKNSTFTEIFEKEFPERFVQNFIAEQNMVSVTTGLESRGNIPFAATFGAFFARAHDQIRMAGIGRNALRLCGSHCGVSIGEDGPSQMALEDLAMMRSIPDSIVLYPSDGVSAYKLTELMANYHDGISYLRTTRSGATNLYGKDEAFKIGGSKVLRNSENDQICIAAAGITLHEALKAYEILKNQGVSVSVIDVYSVKPLDVWALKDVARVSGGKILTVEDHYPEGGLGEAIASAFVNDSIQVKSLAVTQISRSGKPEELLALAGIDAENIVKAVLEVTKKDLEK